MHKMCGCLEGILLRSPRVVQENCFNVEFDRERTRQQNESLFTPQISSDLQGLTCVITGANARPLFCICGLYEVTAEASVMCAWCGTAVHGRPHATMMMIRCLEIGHGVSDSISNKSDN
jgi:hypothetical protein